MPLFFLIAGYFSKSFTTTEEAMLNIKKFAKRLLPAFIFTQVAIILWTVLMAITKSEGWNPVIRESLSLIWADPHGPHTPWGRLYLGVIWFLVALFFAKSALLLLSKFKAYAIPISIALAWGAILLHKVFPYSIWCISVGLTALPFVTIGWWFRTHAIPKWLVIVCIGCWITALFFSHLGMYDIDWGCFPLDLLGACGGTLVIYMISKFICGKLKATAKVFAILGIWSLGIMCFHNLETHCHLGNHVMALIPVSLPVWGKYLFRYLLTIAMAAIATKLPVLKRIFS